MADGSAVARDDRSGRLHALNVVAAEALQQRRDWSEPQLTQWLVDVGYEPPTAQETARSFLTSLVATDLVALGSPRD